MIVLNKLKYNNKFFQVFLNDNKNRIIYEIKKDDKKSYYVYPELTDLVGITKKYFLIRDVVFENSDDVDPIDEIKKRINHGIVNISQKVLIAGMVISIALSFVPTIKYSIETNTNPVNSYRVLYLNKITSQDTLDEVINTKDIKVENVHEAIDYNKKLEAYANLIHEYVDDVYVKRPKQNWWIFYQNVKRMTINSVSEEVLGTEVAGTFDGSKSKINYLNGLEDEIKKSVIKHELTHALNRIKINIENYNIDISFNKYGSTYGYKIGEALTSLFNSYCGAFEDIGYRNELLILEPFIRVIGEDKLTEPINYGGIDEFIKICKPYYKDIEKYVSYFDTFFSYADPNEGWIKDSIDEDFLLKFNEISLELYLCLTEKSLESNKLTTSEYLSNSRSYISILQNLVNNVYYEKITGLSSKELITSSFQNELFLKLENKILSDNSKTMIKNRLDELSELYTINFLKLTNGKFLAFSVTSKLREDNPYLSYIDPDPSFNYYNYYELKDYAFIVEKTYYDEKLKLRIVDKNASSLIDIMTNKMVGVDGDILAEVSMEKYLENVIDNIKVGGNVIANDDTFLMVKKGFFDVIDIIDFSNNEKIEKNGYSYKLKNKG